MQKKLTDVGSEIDTKGCNWLFEWVLEQLGHQNVIVLHTDRKFLHICSRSEITHEECTHTRGGGGGEGSCHTRGGGGGGAHVTDLCSICCHRRSLATGRIQPYHSCILERAPEPEGGMEGGGGERGGRRGKEREGGKRGRGGGKDTKKRTDNH